jgi:hypothetical protein
MRLFPPIGLNPRVLAERGNDRGRASHGERLIELSSWMLVLGTIRFTCSLADHAANFLETWRGQPITAHIVSKLAQDNQLIFVLCAAWPLLLCVALRRTR